MEMAGYAFNTLVGRGWALAGDVVAKLRRDHGLEEQGERALKPCEWIDPTGSFNSGVWERFLILEDRQALEKGVPSELRL